MIANGRQLRLRHRHSERRRFRSVRREADAAAEYRVIAVGDADGQRIVAAARGRIEKAARECRFDLRQRPGRNQHTVATILAVDDRQPAAGELAVTDLERQRERVAAAEIGHLRGELDCVAVRLQLPSLVTLAALAVDRHATEADDRSTAADGIAERRIAEGLVAG